ncbi:hypothetical protein GCM10010402_66060 [Actinomadura luteofluorescens]|uniref:hypothetical protein n=1 Tax=Actinomadura luteofluorescens TaxID=46163 RepID=UPI002164CFEA|nr:hypothetical protein [Actinomadura glauciflava]MCR3744221.1 hypothetical protein [Actinomadura glauciflava]
MAYTFADDFEAGTLGPTWSNATAAVTVTSSAAYAGTYGVRQAATPSNAGIMSLADATLPDGWTWADITFRCRQVSHTTANSPIITVQNRAGADHFDLFVNYSAGGVLWWDLLGANSASAPFVLGQWYKIRCVVFFGGTTWTARVWVDDVEQTPIATTGKTASDVRAVHFGGFSSETNTRDFDDVSVLLTDTNPVPPPSGTGSITATASLSSSGTKTGRGTGAVSAAAAVSGTGVKTGRGTGAITATATLTGSGTQPNPPAFPRVPLTVDVELRVGDVWERVTGDVLHGEPITLERGRADEAATVAPSKLALTLRNTAGKYSPRNPRSPYYGLLGRNTPIRVRVVHPDLPDAETRAYLPGVLGSYLSTPNTAALALTSGLDARVDITPDSWRPGVGMMLAGRADGQVGGSNAWMFMLMPTGQLRFFWSPDGLAAAFALSSVPVPETTARRAVRVVFAGGASWTVTFYTADTLAGPWVQLDSALAGASPTSILAGTVPLEVGAVGGGDAFTDMRTLHGDLHGFQLANGAGTVVADPAPAAQVEGAGTWTGADGLPWTARGAARILSSTPATRFTGEVAAWPPRWSLGGHHQTIQVDAAGIKRRLGQGAAPVESALRRTTLADPAVVAYWPMEDAGGMMSSALPGAPALRLAQNPAGIGYGAESGFVGSAPLATFADGGLFGAVPPYTPPALVGSIRTHTVLLLLHVPDGGLGGSRRLVMLRSSGTLRRWDLWCSSGGDLAVTAYDAEGNKANETVLSLPVAGGLLHVEWQIQETAAGSVSYTVGTLTQGNPDSWTSTGSAVSGTWTVGQIGTVTVGDSAGLGDTAIGHIAVLNTLRTTLDQLDAFEGYAGETAGARLARLAAENGVPMRIVGDLSATTAMGPQRVGALLDLLEEAAAADGGILGEARDEAGFVYRARASMYNQGAALALTYGAPGLAAPFEPVDDDQAIRNRVAVSREGGSSAVAELTSGPLSTAAPPDGVGAYDTSATLNVATDDQLANLAGWLLGLGTVDEARYPALGVKLHKTPALLPSATALDLGDRATVAGMPPWLPPDDVDALVQGYVETIELTRWRIDCNATPGAPWQVAMRGEARRDSSGSTLGAAVGADDTSLTVASAGVRWTTSAGDFPFDISVGGERMTVTSISGTASPQSFTVVRAVNGVRKAHTTGARVGLFRASPRAL